MWKDRRWRSGAANILWDEQAGRALVSDFGIAAIHEPSYARGDPDRKPLALTEAGMIVGTPRYMSPEQAPGDLLATMH
jgi:serine/threonine protein kinase